MKHFYLKSMLLGILSLFSLSAAAVYYSHYADGIHYGVNVQDGTAIVSRVDNIFTNVVIPESVLYDDGTYHVNAVVNAIEAGAFSGDSLTSVTIPNSVTSIGDDAFRGCENLTSITIPNSVTTIGDGAFLFCTSLTNVTIPNSVTTIGQQAFAGCYSLTNITLPTNGLTSIGSFAFLCCLSLTSITLPNSLTSIEEGTFQQCSGLTSIDIPNGVTSIGDYAFCECTSLTSANIPNSVTTIGEHAFEMCENLTRIIIPNSVTSIGGAAFSTESLKDVYSFIEIPFSIPYVFAWETYEYGTLHVPTGCKSLYEQTTCWNYFGIFNNIVEFETVDVSDAQRTSAEAESVCDLQGRSLSAPQHGLNIVKMSDGTTRKVMMK